MGQTKQGKNQTNTNEYIFREASKVLNPKEDTVNYWKYFWNRMEEHNRDDLAERANKLIEGKQLYIYTDGSCSKDHEKAGWGIVVTKETDGDELEYYGNINTNFRDSLFMGAYKNTNNTAELTAMGKAFEHLVDIKTMKKNMLQSDMSPKLRPT